MPQARNTGSRKSTTSRRSTASTRATSSGAKSSGAAKRGTRKTASSSGSRSTASSRSRSTAGNRPRSTSAGAGSADARLEAAAQRLRKLNERIIEASKDAGEATLASYEKALKTIASGIERGPGSSEVEWISNLATAQAKFLRDVTTSWTAAARKMLE